jgi:adenosylhomocysteine nucleosidase
MLAIVTGLAAEARIAGLSGATIVGGGRSDRLAADLQAAIAKGATRLLSFGVAGGLAPALRPGDLVVAAGVVEGHEHWICDAAWSAAMIERLTSPSLRAQRSNPRPGATYGLLRLARKDGWKFIDGAGLSADIVGVKAPVASAAAKAALHVASGAAAVDMESAIVAQAAVRHGLPFAVLRIVADPAERALPRAALVAMREDGGINVAAVLSALARAPQQWPAFAQLALDSRKAFSELARARALLGADFAGVDLGDL